MSKSQHLFVLLPILALLVWAGLSFSSTSLQPGAIRFIDMQAEGHEMFEIATEMELPAQSVIRFTDSEWNGNRFGSDEGDLIWHTGDKVIPQGTIIHFHDLEANPKVSVGSVFGQMRLSKTEEAIFAYVGGHRMPSSFIAVISNKPRAYGSIANTGLVVDSSYVTSR